MTQSLLEEVGRSGVEKGGNTLVTDRLAEYFRELPHYLISDAGTTSALSTWMDGLPGHVNNDLRTDLQL